MYLKYKTFSDLENDNNFGMHTEYYKQKPKNTCHFYYLSKNKTIQFYMNFPSDND